MLPGLMSVKNVYEDMDIGRDKFITVNGGTVCYQT